MIFAILLAMQGLSPESAAVMDRSRREATERRANEASAQANARAQAEETLPLSPEIAARLQKCLDAAIADPATGIIAANEWEMAGGSYHAMQCRAFAHARAEQWDQAEKAFDTAARTAQKAGSAADAARLSAQAGNAALAGGQAQRALGHFDAALANGMADGLAKGEAFLDRGRANVTLGRLEAGRSDLDQAIKLAPQDPLVWLLSATLARRMNDLPRATKDIAQAVRLASDDASVALEQGNIAILSGDETTARSAWNRAISLAPQSPQAKAAREALAQLDTPPATPAAQ